LASRLLRYYFEHPRFVFPRFVYPRFVYPRFVFPRFVFPRFVFPRFVYPPCITMPFTCDWFGAIVYTRVIRLYSIALRSIRSFIETLCGKNIISFDIPYNIKYDKLSQKELIKKVISI